MSHHITGSAKNVYTYGTNIDRRKEVFLTRISTKREWQIIKPAVDVAMLLCTVLAFRLYISTFVGFFVCGMMGRFGDD